MEPRATSPLALYLELHPALLRYARALGHGDEAQDLVHDAFLELLQRLRAGSAPAIARLGPWLYGTVRYSGCGRARRRRRQVTVPFPELLDLAHDRVRDDAADPLEHVARLEEQRLLALVLDPRERGRVQRLFGARPSELARREGSRRQGIHEERRCFEHEIRARLHAALRAARRQGP